MLVRKERDDARKQGKILEMALAAGETFRVDRDETIGAESGPH
jgi:hypothetical protein